MTLAVTAPCGTDHDIKVTVTGKNLTGATAKWVMVPAHGGAHTLEKTTPTDITIVGGANSTVTVHIYYSDTADKTVMQYFWQLGTVLSDVHEIIESGTFTLTDNDITW